jgi:flagellar transcriptional activator FlhD
LEQTLPGTVTKSAGRPRFIDLRLGHHRQLITLTSVKTDDAKVCDCNFMLQNRVFEQTIRSRCRSRRSDAQHGHSHFGTPAMTHASHDLSSIRELNLSYLALARRVLASDREAAQTHLGLSAEIADTLLKLSPAETDKLASSSQLLCFFRMSADAMLGGLASRSLDALGSALNNEALVAA